MYRSTRIPQYSTIMSFPPSLSLSLQSFTVSIQYSTDPHKETPQKHIRPNRMLAETSTVSQEAAAAATVAHEEVSSSKPVKDSTALPMEDSFTCQVDDGFHSDGSSGLESPPPRSYGPDLYSDPEYEDLIHYYENAEEDEAAATVSAEEDEEEEVGYSLSHCDAQRMAVLSYDQVRKLNNVMDDVVSIHGRGHFPTIEVKLRDLVAIVRRQLETDVAEGGAGMTIGDIRLNGGAASHVLASESQPYNDLDLIFAVEFNTTRNFDRVKSAVLHAISDLLPDGVSRDKMSPCILKEAYVSKMVKVNNNDDGDRWSLISLGNSPGHTVELKFVDRMKRQFEFSVDSFQVILDSLLVFYDCAQLPISENFYPTVVGESVYGDFHEALYHLDHKLIATRQPEEIRGGGLLKYCNLLVRNYRAQDPEHIKTLERYMCSRFFIDFTDFHTQSNKLEAYLRNHFFGTEDEHLQYQYLMYLYDVVETSTICLMGRERRQTLTMIENLAMQILQRQQSSHAMAQAQAQGALMSTAQSNQCLPPPPPQQTQPGLLYTNFYYTPVIPICTCNSQWMTTGTTAAGTSVLPMTTVATSST